VVDYFLGGKKLFVITGCDFSAVLELRTLVTFYGMYLNTVQLVTAFVSIPVHYFVYQYALSFLRHSQQ
jgi:hypothetical protein